jgi:hypothetical protein
MEGKSISVIGREAWALDNLMRYGETGVTPTNAPGPRWAHYVFKLRSYGLVIETVREEHGGPFSGSHARYVLRTPVTIKRIVRLGDMA